MPIIVMEMEIDERTKRRFEELAEKNGMLPQHLMSDLIAEMLNKTLGVNFEKVGRAGDATAYAPYEVH